MLLITCSYKSYSHTCKHENPDAKNIWHSLDVSSGSASTWLGLQSSRQARCAGVVSMRLSFRVFAVCHFPYYSIKGDNFCPSPAALKQMEVIEIPTTVLFQKMLKKLGLTSPTYKPHMSEEAKLGGLNHILSDN